jgi:DNA-binding transcriptional MerR regulator
MNKKSTYSISELSKIFMITSRTIRYYESEGLISPKRQGTQRCYNHRDKIRLQLILRGKRVGFSLAEIKAIIDLYTLPFGEDKQKEWLLAKIEERRETLYQQQKDIQLMLKELEQLKQRIQPSTQK